VAKNLLSVVFAPFLGVRSVAEALDKSVVTGLITCTYFQCDADVVLQKYLVVHQISAPAIVHIEHRGIVNAQESEFFQILQGVEGAVMDGMGIDIALLAGVERQPVLIAVETDDVVGIQFEIQLVGKDLKDLELHFEARFFLQTFGFGLARCVIAGRLRFGRGLGLASACHPSWVLMDGEGAWRGVVRWGRFHQPEQGGPNMHDSRVFRSDSIVPKAHK